MSARKEKSPLFPWRILSLATLGSLLMLGSCVEQQQTPIGPLPIPTPGNSTANTAPTPANLSVVPGPAAKADVPFQVDLQGFTVDGFPGIHSAVHAHYQGKLILVGGRKNGLHNFPLDRKNSQQVDAFPVKLANDTIYVLDLENRKLIGSASVAKLPKPLADLLTATNASSFVKDKYFYISGGYGVTSNGQSMWTTDAIAAIDMGALVDAIVQKTPLDQAFAEKNIYMGNDPNLKICGGAMVSLADRVLLFYGHRYDGLYTTGGAAALQVYSGAVRAFQFSFSDTKNKVGLRTITVKFLGADPTYDQTNPPSVESTFNRRDLSVLPVNSPDGKPRVGVFGGVFKGGRMEGFVTPLYVTDGNSQSKAGVFIQEDTSAAQLLSQYETAVLPVYSARDQVMYTTFFGGISQFYWNADKGTLEHDTPNFNITPAVDGLPFINSISTLRVGKGVDGKDETGDFVHLGQQFPPKGNEPVCGSTKAGYLGANAIFVPAGAAPMDNDVILLDKIDKAQVIGYVVGGIAAQQPYAGPNTCASNVIYRVTLNPAAATSTAKLSMPK